MEKYVTPQEFERLAKGKKVREFPNPLMKEIDGVLYEIMKPEAMCKVMALPHEHYEWFLGCTFEEYQRMIKDKYGEDNSEVIEIWTDTKAGYSWFPTELVCGTVNVSLGYGIVRKLFSVKSDLAKKTGYLQSRNCTGSFACYFRSAKVNEAIRILNANHWNCPEYEKELC